MPNEMTGNLIENLIQKAMARATPGQKFSVRSFDTDSGPVGPVISCVVVDKLPNRQACPLILAHVGETQDVSLLYLTADEIGPAGARPGDVALTAIVVCGSDAQMDYDYPEKMLSDEWAGALFIVLD